MATLSIEAKYNLITGNLIERRQACPGHAPFNNYALTNVSYVDAPFGSQDYVLLANFPPLLGGGDSFRFIVTNQEYGGTVIADIIDSTHVAVGNIQIPVGNNALDASNLYIRAIHRNATLTDRVEIFYMNLPISRGFGGTQGDAFIDRSKIGFQMNNRMLAFGAGAVPGNSTIRIYNYFYNGVFWEAQPISSNNGVVGTDNPLIADGTGAGNYIIYDTVAPNHAGLRNLIIEVTAPDGSKAYYGSKHIDSGIPFYDSDRFNPLVVVRDSAAFSTHIVLSDICYYKTADTLTAQIIAPTGSFNNSGGFGLRFNFDVYNRIADISGNIFFTDPEQNAFWNSGSVLIENFAPAAPWAQFTLDANSIYGPIGAAAITFHPQPGDTDYFEINSPMYYSTFLKRVSNGFFKIRNDLSNAFNLNVFGDDESLGGRYVMPAGTSDSLQLTIYDRFLRLIATSNNLLDNTPPVIVSDINLTGPNPPDIKLDSDNSKIIAVFQAQATDIQANDSGISQVFVDMRNVGDTVWRQSIPMQDLGGGSYEAQLVTSNFFGLSGAIEYQLRVVDNAGNTTLSPVPLNANIIPNPLSLFTIRTTDTLYNLPVYIIGQPIVLEGNIGGTGAYKLQATITRSLSADLPIVYNNFPPQNYTAGWQQISLPGLILPGFYNVKLEVNSQEFNFGIFVMPLKEDKDDGLVIDCPLEKLARLNSNSGIMYAQNNENLNYLRGLRDRVIRNIPGGNSFINWYYQDLAARDSYLNQWLFADQDRIDTVWSIVNTLTDTARDYHLVERLSNFINIINNTEDIPLALNFSAAAENLNNSLRQFRRLN